MRILFFIGLLIIIHLYSYGQEVEIIEFQKLDQMIHQDYSRVKVFNFWATWCKPCIEELPYFEQVQKENPKLVKVNLISLDFPSQIESKLIPFLIKYEIQSEVKLLDETDFNAFINIIDERWSGALPATLIVARESGEKYFYEKQFKKGELDQIIKKLIN